METETDVTAESSTQKENTNVVEEVVQPEPSDAPAVTEEQPVDVSGLDASFPGSAPGQTAVDEEVDEHGVPYKNRFHEYKRKFDETSTQLSEMKGMIEKLSTQKQTEETPQYTIADLEAYKQEHPEYAAWCEQEKVKLMQEQIVQSVRGEFEQREQAKQAQQIKQSALQTVAQTFPEVFAKDAQGRVTGWDMKNPLTQRIMQYGQDPGIANRPDGLVLAAKLAAGDLYQAGLSNTQRKVATQQAEIGDLQRKTAIEGGGVAPVQQNSRAQALSNVQATGSLKAASGALQNIFKDAGILD